MCSVGCMSMTSTGARAALGDGQHHARGEVRRQEDDDHVAVRGSQPLGCCRSLVRVADEADVDDVAVHPVQRSETNLADVLELVQQPRELRPVGAQATGHETDANGPVSPTLESSRPRDGIVHVRLLRPRTAGDGFVSGPPMAMVGGASMSETGFLTPPAGAVFRFRKSQARLRSDSDDPPWSHRSALVVSPDGEALTRVQGDERTRAPPGDIDEDAARSRQRPRVRPWTAAGRI